MHRPKGLCFFIMSENLKRIAAEKALEFIENGMIVGVGSGTTVNCFIEALGKSEIKIKGAVCSSVATENLLRAYHVPILDLNEITSIAVYVDGADQIDANFVMIKGGGAALTREKIVASASGKYICIIDPSKQVDHLSHYSVPIEVIPMAREYVIRELNKMGGHSVWRQGIITDNGNQIIDTKGLDLSNPIEMETRLNRIAGVVDCGIFAFCPANIVVIGCEPTAQVLINLAQ